MNSTYEKFSRHGRLIRTTLTRTVRRSALISLTSLLCVATPWATATPLPAGTKLTITESTNGQFVSATGCAHGSCFGMFLFADLLAWTPIPPGTDGGIIIGKAQKSGGQEVNGLSSNNGEVTAVWVYGGNNGTFFTAPSDTGNVFDDASCTGSGCGSNTTPKITALAVWNTAWGGQIIPMGSAAGCNKTLLPACTVNQVAGIFVDSWTVTGNVFELKYSQTVPAVFTNYPYQLVLRGTIVLCDPCAALTPDDNSVRPNTLVTLTGTCTTAVAGTTITTCPITQTSGTTVTLSSPTLSGIGTTTATNTVTFTPTANDTYVFRLTATRNGSGTASNNTGDATVTVSSAVDTFPQASTSEGCSMTKGATVNPSERFDWWLVMGFIAWLGMIIRRRQKVLV